VAAGRYDQAVLRLVRSMAVCRVDDIRMTAQDELAGKYKVVVRIISIECDQAACLDVLLLAPAAADEPAHESGPILDFAFSRRRHLVVLRHRLIRPADLADSFDKLLPGEVF